MVRAGQITVNAMDSSSSSSLAVQLSVGSASDVHNSSSVVSLASSPAFAIQAAADSKIMKQAVQLPVQVSHVVSPFAPVSTLNSGSGNYLAVQPLVGSACDGQNSTSGVVQDVSPSVSVGDQVLHLALTDGPKPTETRKSMERTVQPLVEVSPVSGSADAPDTKPSDSISSSVVIHAAADSKTMRQAAQQPVQVSHAVSPCVPVLNLNSGSSNNLVVQPLVGSACDGQDSTSGVVQDVSPSVSVGDQVLHLALTDGPKPSETRISMEQTVQPLVEVSPLSGSDDAPYTQP